MPNKLSTPSYNKSDVTPGIAHFGVGNFHRSHQAMYLVRLFNQGTDMDWGIIGIGVMPNDARMRDALAAQDYRYTLVEVAGDGSKTGHQIGSICGFLHGPDDPEAVLNLLANPDIRIVSLTITEGGYNIDRVTGKFDLASRAIQADLANPSRPNSVFGYISEALRRRRAANVSPFTVMSCDNLPGNGYVAKQAILTYAREVDSDLAQWIEASVSFPNSMVDRITPVTTDADRAMVKAEFGLEDRWPVICEPFTQWVLEDDFCYGRPALETVGVQVVRDVAPYELMKLRLLNGTHQAMAYIGMLTGHTFVHEAVADARIERFLRDFLAEARPTLAPVPGIDIDTYIESLFERFANPGIADTLARLAVDASDRIPKFVLPTIRDNIAAGRGVTAGAAVIAHWAKYLATAESVVDPLGPILVPLAHSENPLDLVCYKPVFGDLVESSPFADSYVKTLLDL